MIRSRSVIIAGLVCAAVAGISGLAVFTFASAPTAAADARMASAIPAQAAMDPGLVAVTLHVQSLPAGASTTSPLADLEIDALAAGNGNAAPVASAVSDADGAATLNLPPGTYWVVIPQSAASGALAGATMDSLPDATPVVAWEPIDISDGNPVAVTLLVQTPAQP